MTPTQRVEAELEARSIAHTGLVRGDFARALAAELEAAQGALKQAREALDEIDRLKRTCMLGEFSSRVGTVLWKTFKELPK